MLERGNYTEIDLAEIEANPDEFEDDWGAPDDAIDFVCMTMFGALSSVRYHETGLRQEHKNIATRFEFRSPRPAAG